MKNPGSGMLQVIWGKRDDDTLARKSICLTVTHQLWSHFPGQSEPHTRSPWGREQSSPGKDSRHLSSKQLTSGCISDIAAFYIVIGPFYFVIVYLPGPSSILSRLPNLLGWSSTWELWWTLTIDSPLSLCNACVLNQEQRHSPPSTGDIWQYLETYLTLTTGEGGATGSQWGGVKDAVK